MCESREWILAGTNYTVVPFFAPYSLYEMGEWYGRGMGKTVP